MTKAIQSDDLRFDTYWSWNNWTLRVTDLGTGRVLHARGLGHDAYQRALRELSLKLATLLTREVVS